MLLESLKLMIIGMSVVGGFLIILMYSVTLMGKLVPPDPNPAPTPATSATTTGQDQGAITAAISIAVALYRKQRGH